MTMRIEQNTAAMVIMGLALGALGCRGAARDDTVMLAGRIVIDGQPVRKGGIRFMPLDRGHPAYSDVQDGRYSARVPKGRLRVFFSAVEETGRMVQSYSAKVPELIDAVPPTLRDGVEITVDGDDAARDFVLSSEAQKPS